LDGRTYPEHLREFERYDGVLLPLVQDGRAVTFDDLVNRITDRKVRAMLPRWLASAQWRGLIERHDGAGRQPWTYVLGPQGQSQTPHAA
jgi:hypothetical protein